MDKRIGAALVALPLAIGGVVYASVGNATGTTLEQVAEEVGYTCPATGEELPCKNCCPLEQE